MCLGRLELPKHKEEKSMFGENLKSIRKSKGYTQEELAIKLNVVRQTVSKWEKGLSVPDADILVRIAETLDTDVSVLLGGSVEKEADKDAVAEQLAKISEQAAIKNRRAKRIWKAVIIILSVIVIFNILLIILGTSAYKNISNSSTNTVVEAVDSDTVYSE
jgi:bacteriophage CI repressor helix-turn-helix domain